MITTVFNFALSCVKQVFSTALSDWGIFGSWLVFCVVLRYLYKTFIKLKA